MRGAEGETIYLQVDEMEEENGMVRGRQAVGAGN